MSKNPVLETTNLLRLACADSTSVREPMSPNTGPDIWEKDQPHLALGICGADHICPTSADAEHMLRPTVQSLLAELEQWVSVPVTPVLAAHLTLESLATAQLLRWSSEQDRLSRISRDVLG